MDHENNCLHKEEELHRDGDKEGGVDAQPPHELQLEEAGLFSLVFDASFQLDYQVFDGGKLFLTFVKLLDISIVGRVASEVA
jgi:hypothetical protein